MARHKSRILANIGEVAGRRFSRICTRKLLLMRLEIKEILRGLSAGECSVEDLLSTTKLDKESILAVLRKHGYGIEQEDCSDDVKSAVAGHPLKGNNVTFDLPCLICQMFERIEILQKLRR
ncbi:hypothetical protein KIN20_015335 [Parelaphostrongylus tenuis]|uniref:Uncharacterized protein n=1 Tax=Parelaphostrongylus tenuis TaxID=148309 RepID=A0AAD5QPV6_PARTN|nr:hypothetical protein KIN20_015335 [Parelaphostrongylus tenuis]